MRPEMDDDALPDDLDAPDPDDDDPPGGAAARQPQAGLFAPLVAQSEAARTELALVELIAACRKMIDKELPAIDRAVRAIDRVHALRRLAEASEAFYLAVETAAFRIGLERKEKPPLEQPLVGRRAW